MANNWVERRSGLITHDIRLMNVRTDADISATLTKVSNPDEIMAVARDIVPAERIERYEEITGFTHELFDQLGHMGINRQPFFSQIAAAYDITTAWDEGSNLAGLFDDMGMGKTFTTLITYAMWNRKHPNANLYYFAENKTLIRAYEELRALGLDADQVFCWVNPNWSQVNLVDKRFLLRQSPAKIMLFNANTLQDEASTSEILRKGDDQHMVAVDESHKIRRRKDGKIADRTKTFLDFSSRVRIWGGKGLLMSATPTEHDESELHDWSRVWQTPTIPVVKRHAQDYFEMPELQATTQGITVAFEGVQPQRTESVAQYFRKELLAEGGAIIKWFVDTHLPEALRNPNKRILAFSPFVNEDKVTGPVSLEHVGRILSERGIKTDIVSAQTSSADDVIKQFLDNGQVLLLSFASGAESFTINAPERDMETVILLPPEFWTQLYQAVGRTYRPIDIGIGDEPVRIITPQAVRKDGSSITGRIYHHLQEAHQRGGKATKNRSAWSAVANSLQAPGADEVSISEILPPGKGALPIQRRRKRRGAELKAEELQFDLPPTLDYETIAHLYHDYLLTLPPEEADGTDQTALRARNQEILDQIYLGVMGHVWNSIAHRIERTDSDFFRDIVQEFYGLHLKKILENYRPGETTFQQYLELHIWYSFPKIKTKITGQYSYVSLDAPIERGSSLTLLDQVSDSQASDDISDGVVDTSLIEDVLSITQSSAEFDVIDTMLIGYWLRNSPVHIEKLTNLIYKDSPEIVIMSSMVGLDPTEVIHRFKSIKKKIQQSKVLKGLFLGKKNSKVAQEETRPLTPFYFLKEHATQWRSSEDEPSEPDYSMDVLLRSTIQQAEAFYAPLKHLSGVELSPRTWHEFSTMLRLLVEGNGTRDKQTLQLLELAKKGEYIARTLPTMPADSIDLILEDFEDMVGHIIFSLR